MRSIVKEDTSACPIFAVLFEPNPIRWALTILKMIVDMCPQTTKTKLSTYLHELQGSYPDQIETNFVDEEHILWDNLEPYGQHPTCETH